MSSKKYLVHAALLAVIALSACAPVSRGGQAGEFQQEKATLLVENNNWADMAIYLVRDGMRTRLGTAPSLGRTRFVLPDAMIGGSGELRLLADPIGSTQRFLSQPIHVTPGDQVRFRLENNVQLSSYSVY